MSALQPVPTGNEIKLDPKRYIVSKTDLSGKIMYANEYFTEVSGYSEYQLIGTPHNILRHPDMPKVIFYLMWKRLKNGENMIAVVKNLAKNGDHYWVTTGFDIKHNRMGNVRHYIAFRQAAPKHVIKEIEPLYTKLLRIEKERGFPASIDYFNLFLKEKNMDYDQFIEKIAKPKGIAAVMFQKMKSFFI